jgi:hypothetical protein
METADIEFFVNKIFQNKERMEEFTAKSVRK